MLRFRPPPRVEICVPPPEISGGSCCLGSQFYIMAGDLTGRGLVGVHRDLFCPARKLPPTKVLIQKRLIPIFFREKNFACGASEDWTGPGVFLV